MSWLSENVFDPIGNVGNALIHGDIFGGKYQASGSDWGKAALDVAAIGTAGIGAAGLAGVGPAAGLFGAEAATEGAAAGSIADVTAGMGGGGGATAGLSSEATGAFASAAPESMAAPLSLTPAQTVAGDFSALDSMAMGANPSGTMLGGGAGAPMSLAPTGGAGAATGGGGSFLSGMGVTNPWALGGAALSGVGLASSLMRGDSHPAAQDQASNTAKYLQNEGTALTAEGQQLQKYLASGTLPPALKSQVDQALRAEKARIISGHASKGLSTNPTQNSALAQELSAAERNALNLAGDLETKLFESGNKLITTGLNATGLSGQMYQWLTTQDKQDQAEVGKALAAFAASLGGAGAKGSQVNLRLG